MPANRVADLRPDNRPVDKDVKVPAAVARAAAAADAAQRAAYGEPDAPAPGPDDTITIAEPPAPVPPPDTVTSVGNTPPPQPAPQPPQPPAPKQPIPDTGAGDTFEARYNAMYGRFREANTLITQMTPRLEMLEDRVAELMTENATLRTQPQAAAPAQLPPSDITDKDREEFGPEMIGLIERIARSVAAPAAETLKELKELKNSQSTLADRLNSTSQQQAKSAQQMMMAKLDDDLPAWRQINHMDEYKAWLALPDRFSGVIRHKLLKEAWERNDTPTVFAFFESFASELAASAPAALPQPAPPAPRAQPAKPGLESLAAPGRARQPAGGTPAPAEKQIITTTDVNAFYTDVRLGKYRGREAEKEALEAELFLAQREGRVVPG